MSFLYLNPGYGNLFDNISQTPFTQSTSVGSKTGLCFHSCGQREIIFPTPLDEVWAKVDIYIVREWQQMRICIQGNSKYADFYMPNNTDYYQVRVNGSNKFGQYTTRNEWLTVLMHVKSGVSDGVYEFWLNGVKLFSFVGDVLGQELATKFFIISDGDKKQFSQIIVSDSPIKWTENVIVLPTSISTNMTDTGDGTYSATNSGEYIKQTIDVNALRNSYPDNTVITGICVAGRPAYHDGEGIDVMQAIEGDTVFGECQLSYNENISITYGKRVNMPISTVSGTYGWKAK